LIQSAATTTQPGTTNPAGYGNYAQVPYWTSNDTNAAPNGSVWLKTGATGGGSNFVFKQYNATTGLWNSLAVDSYSNDNTAIYGLDPLGGGLNIPVGTIFMREDPNSTNIGVMGYAGWRARVRTVAGAVSATSSIPANANNLGWTSGSQFVMGATTVGASTPTVVTVTVNGTGASDFVAAVQAAAGSISPSLPVTAQVNANGSITVTHTAGGQIVFTPLGGVYNVPALAGFATSGLVTVKNVRAIGSNPTTAVLVLSGFSNAVYTLSSTVPVADPVDGTLWYYSDPTIVDIMVNTGTAWKGYKVAGIDARGYNLGNTDANGVIAAAVAPMTQNDGSAVAPGDLWLNTSDLENWPSLSRWNGSAWVKIDNTDQISTNGILFADARWDNTGTNDPASGTEITTQELLSSNYLD